MIGLNHNTAPIEIRECIAFSTDEAAQALKILKQEKTINEILLISTCNRVEILLVTENRSKAIEIVKNFISEFNKINISRFDKQLYIHENNEAVRHVFRVASSLDSMIVGEPQILGQLKEAYNIANENESSGLILNRLLSRAFFVAKRVRSETGIGGHAVSISYAAIELGRKIFDTLENKKVLLIGAGEMAELAVEHLLRNRVGKIFVANRTFERGVILAQRFNGNAIRFEEITDYLNQADIVVSSTGASGFVITHKQIKGAMHSRRNRPIFFIDIAVPRDIDPEINRLPNTYVYDIDDLKGVIQENVEDRKREAVIGERIVDEVVIHFQQWYENLDVVPTIVALRKKIDAIVQGEGRKLLQTLSNSSEEDRQAVTRMTNALVKKILHDPALFLKSDCVHENKSLFIDITRKLFNIDD
ncbi:MAG: glutamyl-tRNA reductase [Desulfobacterales bacterium]